MIGPWWRAASWLALALLSLAAPARATTTIHADGLETMADTGWLPFTGIKSFSSGYGTPSNWATPGDGNYTELAPSTNFVELVEGGARYMGPLSSGYGPYYLEFEWPNMAALPATTQFVRGYEFRLDILVQAYAADGLLLPPEQATLVVTSAYVEFDGFGGGSGEKADFIDLPAGLPPGTAFGSHFIGGPADLWNGATPSDLLAQTTAEKHLPATWKQWSGSHKVRLQLTNTGDTLVRAWVDFAAARLTYVPIAEQYARSVGTGTLSAAIKRARLLSPAAVTGRGTVTAGLKSGTNLASRIYSGPVRGGGTLGVVLTKSVGGVRSTYLYPEPKASGTLAATLRKGFSAKPTASGTLTATMRAMRNAYPSAKEWVANGIMSAALRAQRRIAATAGGTGTLAATMTRARSLAPAPTASGILAAFLRAQRPLAAAPAATGTLSAGLYAARPVDAAGTTTMAAGGTMAVLLQKAFPLAATMQGGGTLHGDEGRANPDLTNLFWMPSQRYVDVDPWSRDVDAGAWDRDVDASV